MGNIKEIVCEIKEVTDFGTLYYLDINRVNFDNNNLIVSEIEINK